MQGVFYRASTKSKADSLDLKGYVKNEQDGSVLILASGEIDDVNLLIKWCWKGSDFARVEEVRVQEIENFPEIQGFEIQQ